MVGTSLIIYERVKLEYNTIPNKNDCWKGLKILIESVRWHARDDKNRN